MKKPTDNKTRSLAMLFVAMFIAYTYNNIFMIISPLYVFEIGGGMAEAGLQGTIYIAAAVLFRFFFGPLADKQGAKPVMLLGFAAFMLASILFAGCSETWTFILLRCIQALGLAAIFPCGAAVVVALAPLGKQGLFLGFYRLVSFSSLLVGPTLTLLLVQASGYTTSSLLLGLFVLVALILIFLIPKKHFFQPAKSKEVSINTEKRTRAIKRSKEDNLIKIMCNTFLENPVIIGGVIASVFAAALGYGLLINFAVPYLDNIFPDSNSGLFFTMIGLGGLTAAPLAGWASDKLDNRLLLAVSFLFLGMGISFLGLYSSELVAFFLSGFLAGFGYSGVTTSVLSIIAERIKPQYHASALSLQQNGIDIGIAFASGGFGIIFGMVQGQSSVFLFHGILTFVIGTALFIAVFALARKTR